MSIDTGSKRTGRGRFAKLPQELDRPQDRLDYMDEATFAYQPARAAPVQAVIRTLLQACLATLD